MLAHAWQTVPERSVVRSSEPFKFWWTPIDVVALKFRKMYPTGNRRNRALFTDRKKTTFRLPFKLSLLRGWRPKFATAGPQQYTHSADFIQIRSLSAEL